jgi:PAS domain S-box-containing protein
MALIRASLLDLIEDVGGPQMRATRSAVSRLLDLELAVMLESYRHDFLDRLERVTKSAPELPAPAGAGVHAHYVNAVELAPLLVVGLDRKGAIVLFNREAERATGYARDEALGRSFTELLIPEHVRTERPTLFRRDTVDAATEVPLLTRAGKLRAIRWQTGRIALEGDAAVSFAIGADVTDEALERERRDKRERLAAVGALASGLAHEIRNPLNGARLHISLLKRSLSGAAPTGDSMEAVQVIDEEIKRLARLVSDFLEFARPRPLAYVTTTAQALCVRLRELVGPAAEAANVELAFDLPSCELAFGADLERLEQALLNLVNNGIEASAATGGRVVVRARREPRHVLLEVEDNGHGVPAGGPSIFDAFFSTKVRGTGLGLAIVHRVVTDHGGNIDVDSRPGRTRFRLKLPVDSQEAQST